MRITPVDSDIPSCVTNNLDYTLQNDFKPGQTHTYCGNQFFGNCSELEFETGFKITLILTRHWYQFDKEDYLCLDWINIEYVNKYPGAYPGTYNAVCPIRQNMVTQKIVRSASHGWIETEFFPKETKSVGERIRGWVN